MKIISGSAYLRLSLENGKCSCFLYFPVLRIRIGDLGSGAFWTPVSGMGYFDADPGSEMDKFRIRDKHPGSATLVFYFTLWLYPGGYKEMSSILADQ